MKTVEKSLKKTGVLLASFLCSGLLSACSTPNGTEYKWAETENGKSAQIVEVDSDPLEPLNRAIFQFNYVVDGLLIKPITLGYEALMPERGQTMVSNFVDNINEPVTFFNSILQADADNSFCTLWRFAINSTVGIGGMFDVASEVGLKNRKTGLGDTFAIYGADSGPYLMLPMLGPSNIRDGLGRLGDVFMDPISYTDDAVFYSVVGIKTIDSRHRNMKILDEIYNNSIDPYSSMRSIYNQHRKSEIKKSIKARNKSIDKTWGQGGQ